MWHTPLGQRVLAGKEKALFVDAAARLLDDLVDECCDPDAGPECVCHTGVACYDRLDVTSRIALLRDLVQALTDPAFPMPDLTAAREAAVYAVFRYVRDEIELEVALQHDLSGRESGLRRASLAPEDDPACWRKRVLDACREALAPVGAVRRGFADLAPHGDDMDEWWCRLEALADRIVWDRDWELEELIVDDPPERARRVKEEMGISRDYFVAVPAILREEQVQEAVFFVRQAVAEHH